MPSHLDPPRNVRKAVIPAGGYGTRLFPATKAVKKELFPILDRDGRVKPVILVIVEEALSAGIEEVGIVVQPADREAFETFFHRCPTGGYFDKLAAKQGNYLQYLQEVGQRVTLLTQDNPEGFGYGVFCARDWVGNESFLLLLGDHVYRSDLEISCAKQLVDLYQQVDKSVIGIEVGPAEEINHRGCVMGIWQEPNAVLQVTRLVEKPDVDYAKQHLQVRGMAADKLLSMFGLYVLPPQIFDYLEEAIRQDIREFDEFQMTTCLEMLKQDLGMIGYLVQGRSFDTGLPEAYRQAVIEFSID